MPITRPADDEFAPYYRTYIDEVPGADALPVLREQREATARFLATVPESRAGFRYAEGKWTLREVIGHLGDSERVFAYRLLRFARADETPLAGFDENHYVPAGGFERRSLADVAGELSAVRDATVALVSSLDGPAALRRGTANGKVMSVRALAWVIAGHETHHLRVIRERYL
ncbi:MAG TPA: DinB family protein [Gemmatimonadales bacterium]|nr:DinB family protein [Gemmatimonadales bacterium]